MHRRLLRTAIATALVAGLVLALAIVHRSTTASAQDHPAPMLAGIPVTIGAVTPRTLPEFLRGIGTVQAFNTVTIESQVDGKIASADFREGEEVRAGTLLFQIDPRPYAAALAGAEAARAKDAAQLTSAEADLARYAKLVRNGFQSRQTYDQQKATVAALHAAIAGDEAAIETAEINLGYTQIRAPIGGRLGARLVDQGNLVRASQNTPLAVINQIRPIYVNFALPQGDLPALRAGQAKAPLAVEAVSTDDEHVLATGELTFIDNQVQAATGTVTLKAEFGNVNERLWPGEFVNVRVVVGTRRNVPTVAETAIQQGPDGDYVYALRKDDTVERRGVVVTVRQDGVAAISAGLTTGDLVVTGGQYRLTDGARVTVGQQADGTAG